MVRYKTVITFRDDKKERFDCFEHPSQAGDYWMIEKTREKRVYIPKEAVKSLQVTDYWKQ